MLWDKHSNNLKCGKDSSEIHNSKNVNELDHKQASNPSKSPDSTVMSAGQLRKMLADVMKGFQAENRKMLQSISEQKQVENFKLSEMLNARIRARLLI